jgi:hypothetical protein
MHHAVQPAGALAAGRALAAGLLVIEVGQALERLHHAGGLVHHDHGAGAEHRPRLGDGVVVHVRSIMTSAGQHRHRRAAGITAFSLRPPRMPPAISSSSGERRAERDLVVARAIDVARRPRTAWCRRCSACPAQEGLAAIAHDPGHRGEGLGVVDRGRLAVQAEAGRERRLEARLALLALDRLEQRGFFAADVGAVAVVRVQLEAEKSEPRMFLPRSRPRAPLRAPPRSAGRSPRSRRGCSCSHAVHAHRVGGDDHALDHACAGCSAGCRGP